MAGFESPMAGEWDDYSRFVGVDGVELPSPVSFPFGFGLQSWKCL